MQAWIVNEGNISCMLPRLHGATDSTGPHPSPLGERATDTGRRRPGWGELKDVCMNLRGTRWRECCPRSWRKWCIVCPQWVENATLNLHVCGHAVKFSSVIRCLLKTSRRMHKNIPRRNKMQTFSWTLVWKRWHWGQLSCSAKTRMLFASWVVTSLINVIVPTSGGSPSYLDIPLTVPQQESVLVYLLLRLSSTFASTLLWLDGKYLYAPWPPYFGFEHHLLP